MAERAAVAASWGCRPVAAEAPPPAAGLGDGLPVRSFPVEVQLGSDTTMLATSTPNMMLIRVT